MIHQEPIDYFKIDAINHSSLAFLDEDCGGSILKWKAYKEGRIDNEKTSSMEFGTLLHTYIFEPEKFDVEIGNKPGEKICQVIEAVAKLSENEFDFLTLDDHFLNYGKKFEVGGKNYKDETILKQVKEGIDYYNFLCSKKFSTKTFISSDDMNKMIRCSESIKNHEQATNLIFKRNNGIIFNEISIEFTIYDRNCKAKLDRIIIFEEQILIIIPDLKTTSNLSEFKSSFEKYKYYRQCAFYREAAKSFARSLGYLNDFKVNSYIVAVETKGQYECKVFKVSEDYIEKGEEELNRLFTLLNDIDELGYEYFANKIYELTP